MIALGLGGPHQTRAERMTSADEMTSPARNVRRANLASLFRLVTIKLKVAYICWSFHGIRRKALGKQWLHFVQAKPNQVVQAKSKHYNGSQHPPNIIYITFDMIIQILRPVCLSMNQYSYRTNNNTCMCFRINITDTDKRYETITIPIF